MFDPCPLSPIVGHGRCADCLSETGKPPRFANKPASQRPSAAAVSTLYSGLPSALAWCVARQQLNKDMQPYKCQLPISVSVPYDLDNKGVTSFLVDLRGRHGPGEGKGLGRSLSPSEFRGIGSRSADRIVEGPGNTDP